MLYRVRRKITKAWFNLNCRSILETPPIPARPNDELIVLSGVGNNDLLMYLVAIKSFMNRLQRGKIMLLVPDDCPPENLEILKRHTNAYRIVRDSEVNLGRCRPGGTWERLVSIVRELDDHYVIQIDSDTVTIGDVPEVAAHVNANASFMIGTWRNQSIDTAAQAVERVKDHASQHVQMLAERRLTELPNTESIRYARGQSSFAGFARGSANFESLEALSIQMESMLGAEKWRQWGSESFASNFVIANSPSAYMLPFPAYSTFCPPKQNFAESSLIHFEGTYRFQEGFYIEQAKRAIARLLTRR